MRGADGKPIICDKVWISSIGCSGDDTTERIGKLTTGFGASSEKIGPEFTFGIYMEKALNEPVLIIKTSWGGRSLMTDFRPPSSGNRVFNDTCVNGWKGMGVDPVKEAARHNSELNGVFYRHMIEHVRKVLGDIQRVVPSYDPKQGYELAGFVWFQGFNDLVDGWSYPKQNQPGGYDEYAELLTHFIRDVRKDLSVPKMPFVIGVMGLNGMKLTHQNEVYFHQAQAAPAALPEFKGNVVAVQTAPFWDDDLAALQARADKKETLTPEEEKRLNAGVSNGGYHYLGAAKIMAPIGKAFAEALVNLK
jgi:alpha-galactosidase